MKKAIKCSIWIFGTIIWILFLLLFRDLDAVDKSHTHEIILILTGICLAIYIFRKTGSRAKELEKENQELKAEVEKLQAELQSQAVRRAMDAAEKREKD